MAVHRDFGVKNVFFWGKMAMEKDYWVENVFFGRPKLFLS